MKPKKSKNSVCEFKFNYVPAWEVNQSISLIKFSTGWKKDERQSPLESNQRHLFYLFKL